MVQFQDNLQTFTSGVDLDVRQTIEPQRVLIIDDDADLVTLLKILLRSEGLDVSGATDHISALKQVKLINPDIILLDLLLPEVDGWGIYKRLRQITQVPVVILTASSNKDFAVKSLEMGAQDFIAKPFYNPELVARIKKILKQSGSTEDPILNYPNIDLQIDTENHEILIRGQKIYLAPQEYAVLKILAENTPKNVRLGTICEQIWKEVTPKHQSQVKNIIFLLRQKIELIPRKPSLIVNYRGLGYKLDAGVKTPVTGLRNYVPVSNGAQSKFRDPFST